MKPSVLAAALALACAQAPAAASSRAPGTPLPPSSILAVLAHREELALDDGQVQQLVQAQRQLERVNAETRDRLAVPTRRTGLGQGEGGGDRPARRRALLGGNERGGEAHRPDALGAEAVARALAEDDTRAFLEAEPIFHRDQWGRAREIAERYRIEYAERREALKRGVPEETR